jgi:hypothetical protein
MTSHARAPLTTQEGRLALGTELADLIRRRDFARAERVLVERLTSHPGQIATACRGVPTDRVRISGWEDVVAGLGRATNLGVGISAVGLDLSNFSDSDGEDWWDKEPVVEVSWYDDSAFPFSTATRRALLTAGESHPVPWSGAGAAAEPAELPVTGLRAVNGALLRGGAARPWSFGADHLSERDAETMLLGSWFLHLRFHEAVARHLEQHGAALGVPVVVGQHGVGPFLVSAYLPGDDPAVEAAGGRPSAVPERSGPRALLERARRRRLRRQELAQDSA